MVDKILKPSFKGPIHNLSTKGNSKLYSNILDVFEAMLQGFQKLNNLNENNHTLLQVVIKAQKFEIKSGMSFIGKWHIEGKIEKF